MALQASPRAQTSIPPDAFPLDAPPARHGFPQPQSPVLGDDRSGTSSRPSSRKPSRRPSGGTGGGSIPATPQQSQPRSPNPNVGSSGSTARPYVTQSSPRTPTMPTAGVTQRRENQEDFSRSFGETVSPPPRTSSHQRPITTSGPSDFVLPVRSQETSQGATDRYASNQREADPRAAESTMGSARSPREPTSGRSQHASLPAPETRRQPSSQSRPERTREPEARPVDMSRGNSEIINRVVVTDPQVDIKREKERQAEAVPARDDGRAPVTPGEVESPRDNSRPQRSRQDFSASGSRRKETRFGEYVLGQTLGEGEFGKVKLGWKKDGSVEVAIKLIRRENLNTNPSRLPKIYREISILRGLSHPNIVRLHEMVETERQIGIILEYASGGELFDYILNHRYLKDNAARRLFAQLVSGVGYLHKKGIVHRDLKLENLLLDRNRNIIITDFGFANTFNPRDELAEEIEYNLTNRDFVKSHNLERLVNGHRRGDLMQTSCGSPCYAAPELVVTDSLYTGRKVDVWSCGVILYAMLAGYLPFDDDPANPEGDNINLLYKYIVSTPLTFPEYVSPHARDLLRRILVPDPRKRADLFEVARHSWLSDYAHVVAHVTSSTTTIGDLTNETVAQDFGEPPSLTRSASVREPSKPHSSSMIPVGGLNHTSKNEEADKGKSSRGDAKRRTVQVEYVAPQSQTVRGEASPPPTQPSFSRPTDPSRRSATKVGSSSAGQPQSPYDAGTSSKRQTQQSGGQMDPPSSRGGREGPRAVSDSAHAFGQYPATSTTRPTTGGSMSSSGGGRLPSRGNSYGQPLAPTLAPTNAQGSLAQPKSGSRNYNISAPIPHQQPSIPDNIGGRPVSQRVPSNRNSGVPSTMSENRGHKRANTFGNVFGRSGSFFGGRSQPQSPADNTRQDRKHPPTSMKVPMSVDSPRQSSDSHRPSFGFSRKNSDLAKTEKSEKPEKTRRFSLLPASFSLKALTGGSKDHTPEVPKYNPDNRPHTSQPVNFSYTNPPTRSGEPQRYEGSSQGSRHVSAPIQTGTDRPPRSAPSGASNQYSQWQPGTPGTPGLAYPLGEPAPTESDASFAQYQPQQANQQPRYPQGFNDHEQEPQPRPSMQQSRGAKLHKPNRKFNDAWDQEHDTGHHSGSTGAARRVMDFFRRRGKARSGDDR